MSPALQAFDFETTPVRTLLRDDQPWFIGKDVCAALEIKNHKDALGRLDDDERAEVGIADPSGTKYPTIISEPGIYRLVFTSRTDAAERFKRWLAHEVLPALRRTGTYTAPVRQDAPEAPVEDRLLWGMPFDKVRAAAIMINTAARLYGVKVAQRLYEAEPSLPHLRPSPQECPVEGFFPEFAWPADGSPVSGSAFYDTYAAWATARDLQPIGPRRFGEAAASRFMRRETGGRMMYKPA